jgi:serine/threonine protein kinase
MIDPAMRLPTAQVVTTTPHYNPLLLTDSKADVMAIGIMIYEILTGTLPFDDVPWEYAGKQSRRRDARGCRCRSSSATARRTC